MSDLYIKELEGKVAHYEAIMSRCPQCKTSLPAPEAESTAASSRPSRSSRLAQQPAAKVPPPALTGTSNPSAPLSTLSSSAPSSKQLQPAAKEPLPPLKGPSNRTAPVSTLPSSTRSSKQLHSMSRAEPQAKDSQQFTSSVPPTASSSRSDQITGAPSSTLRRQPRNPLDYQTTSSVQSSAAEFSELPATSSRTLSTRPSSLSLESARGRQPRGGDLVALDLEYYKKPRPRYQSRRPPGALPRHAEWMRTADIMLEEVPLGRHWRQKLSRMDSSIIAAVSVSITPIPKGDFSPTENVKRDELIRLVRKFAERHSERRLNFEHFILVCLCKVLSSRGIPQVMIVETLQICISDTSRRNIDRYLRGVVWANQMMNELFFTDWGFRAVDLIVIWNRSVSTYGTMASALESRQYFITELTQRNYFEGYQGLPDRRHDTIPWIVKKELGDEVSYQDICEALGYNDEYFMKTKHLHSSNPPSPDSNAGDSDDAGSTSRTGSFHTARQSTMSASSPQQSTSSKETPSTYPFNSSHVQGLSLLRSRPLQGAGPDDAAGRGPGSSQSAASRRTNRIVPDRSAKPLGDPDVAPRRRKPQEVPSFTELPSTSLGESAPGTQSTKRPLPDSPTSASGPTDTTRRRQNIRERSSREEMGPPSYSGKKGPNNERRRA